MAFKRGNGVTEAKFSVGLNIVLSGSKKMTEEQVNEILPTEMVKVRITGVPGGQVLVDEMLNVREFTSGNVGFGLHTRGLEFTQGGRDEDL